MTNRVLHLMKTPVGGGGGGGAGVAIESQRSQDVATGAWDFAFTITAANALLIGLSATDNEVDADGLTWNGTPLTKVAAGVTPSGGHIEYWALFNPAPGAFNVTVNKSTAVAGGANSRHTVFAWGLTGVDISGTIANAFHDMSFNGVVNPTNSVTVPATNANGLVCGVANAPASVGSLSVGAPGVLDSTNGYYVYSIGYHAPGTGSAVTVPVTGASDNVWGNTALAVKGA